MKSNTIVFHTSESLTNVPFGIDSYIVYTTLFKVKLTFLYKGKIYTMLHVCKGEWGKTDRWGNIRHPYFFLDSYFDKKS